MPTLSFGKKKDANLKKIEKALALYEEEHPDSEAAFYRQNSVSVRIRIIDPSFEGLSKAERSRRVWPYLRKLPEGVPDEVTLLLLLTPGEAEDSFANFDFTHPIDSSL